MNKDKIDWCYLSDNPNAMELIGKNIKVRDSEICYSYLSKNPSIFTYDYSSMEKRCNIYREQLIANCFHPRNLDKFGSWGFDDMVL